MNTVHLHRAILIEHVPQFILSYLKNIFFKILVKNLVGQQLLHGTVCAMLKKKKQKKKKKTQSQRVSLQYNSS